MFYAKCQPAVASPYRPLTKARSEPSIDVSWELEDRARATCRAPRETCEATLLAAAGEPRGGIAACDQRGGELLGEALRSWKVRPAGIEPAACGLKDRCSLAPRREPLTTELRAPAVAGPRPTQRPY